MKAANLKILRELLKPKPVPRAVKEKHDDIEDAIVKAGGKRGGLRSNA